MSLRGEMGAHAERYTRDRMEFGGTMSMLADQAKRTGTRAVTIEPETARRGGVAK